MRILIVEDDVQAAEAMARGLGEAGHDCQIALDGGLGLDAARQDRFDVIVADRMMPRMDGLTMIETLRRDGDRTPALSVSR